MIPSEGKKARKAYDLN